VKDMDLVLLVDDDILTLNKLRNIIDWNKYGYEIVGQAMNGEDALEMINQFHPNLVLLDINMPKKSGVEVAKEIYEHYNGVYMLALSNYDDFEFVRSAMKYGVYDYILKDQLTPKLLLQKLKEIDDIKIKESIANSRMNYFAAIAKQHYLKNLVLNGVTDMQQHQLMQTQKEFCSNFNIMVVAQVVNYTLLTYFSKRLDPEKIVDSIINLSSNILSSVNNGIISYIENGIFVLLFHFENYTSFQKMKDATFTYMNLLTSNINKFLNINITYRSSDVITDISKLNYYYLCLLDSFKNEPYSNVDMLSIQDGNKASRINIMIEKELMDALTFMDFQKVHNLLRHIFIPYLEQKRPASEVQQVVYQLLRIGRDLLGTYKVELSSNVEQNLLNKFRNPISTQEVYELVLNYYDTILETVLSNSYIKYSPLIQKAIQYIHSNYAHDISLTDVAESLNVSSSHLSRLFKKETSSTFIDYLTNYRIQVAKSLMKNHQAEIKDIYSKVGFQSYNYFLRVFKEKTGYTPSEIKQI